MSPESQNTTGAEPANFWTLFTTLMVIMGVPGIVVGFTADDSDELLALSVFFLVMALACILGRVIPRKLNRNEPDS